MVSLGVAARPLVVADNEMHCMDLFQPPLPWIGRDETRRDETYRRRDDDNRMIIITRRISRTTKGATAGCFEALRLAAAAAAQTIPPPLRALHDRDHPRPPLPHVD